MADPVVSRRLPSPRWPENTPAPPRIGDYREAYVQTIMPNMWPLADEGSYQVACTPGPGTGINGVVNAAFADTVAFLAITNTDTASSAGLRTYIHYVKFICYQAPASATQGRCAIKTCIGMRATGGTALAGKSPNTGAGVSRVTTVTANPTVAALNGTERLVSNSVLRTVIPVLLDEYLFVFGDPGMAPAAPSFALATAQRIVIPCPPVILEPAAVSQMLMHFWFVGNAVTGFGAEVEVGYTER